jgi:hypothetical protein
MIMPDDLGVIFVRNCNGWMALKVTLSNLGYQPGPFLDCDVLDISMFRFDHKSDMGSIVFIQG